MLLFMVQRRDNTMAYFENQEKMIPYIAFESATSRQERTIKRLWILCLVLIIALLGTNSGWIWYENQFEDVSVTQEVEATADGDSDLNLNTVGGDYYGGESEGETNN